MPRKKGGELRMHSQQAPCQNCSDRWRNEQGSCHQNCQKYADYRKTVEQANEQARAFHKQQNEWFSYLQKRRDTPAR